jgi:hypothetical protein
MGSDHLLDTKGKVQPKPSQETAEPQKEDSHVTKAEVQGKLDASTIKRMQKTLGNAAVQRFLAQRQESGPTDIDDQTSSAIQAKKGSGQKLDSSIAEKAGGVMGQDFSDVNVHTDKESDSLNRQLGAKAFTTGNDIFFQSGAYDPGSSAGQELISHELTHVVQQGGSGAPVQGKMTVNDPNDAYESEADSVADMVMNAPDEAVAQRQPLEEEEEMMQPKLDPSLQRQEEEEAMPKLDPHLQRQEEEEAMPKLDPHLQRQEEEEAMPKLDPHLQRQEEEEAMQMKPDPNLQRQDEEEPMMKVDPALQRQEEEEMMAKLDPNLQRQDEEEPMMKVDPALQRQEEEEMMAKLDPSLQRQDEEEPMMKVDPALQRQEEEEGEEMVMTRHDPNLQRQDIPEDEMV